MLATNNARLKEPKFNLYKILNRSNIKKYAKSTNKKFKNCRNLFKNFNNKNMNVRSTQ